MAAKRMFIDVHVVQTVPPSCINRDDTGSPKTCIYGGVRRARVSSQSWKRAIRTEFGKRFDESQLGVRTKRIVEMVADRIRSKDQSISEEDAIAMAAGVFKTGGVNVKLNRDTGVQETGALFFLAPNQADNLADLAIQKCEDKKTVQAAIKKGNAVDIALFGRMVADDPSLNEDASSQVAHAISTHKVDLEYDYFTAMDERSPKDNAGAGMIGTVEFDSETLYRYATVAVHDLKGKLDDDGVAAKATGEFLRAFIMSMPTGKMNTFANRTLPYAVLIVARDDQPVNLASAFEKPVTSDQGGYAEISVHRLVEECRKAEESFVDKPLKTWQIGHGLEQFGVSKNLNDVVTEIEDFIRGAN